MYLVTFIIQKTKEDCMHKIIFTLILVVFSSVVKAQISSEEKEIKSVIATFFKGLHTGDSTLIKKTIHTTIKIQSTVTNKEGVQLLKTQTKKELLTAIARKKPSDVYLEKLGSFTIKIDGNLASVWIPYEFYFNGKFSHCGANSFQLFHNNGKWEIIFLVDMRRREDCSALKEK